MNDKELADAIARLLGIPTDEDLNWFYRERPSVFVRNWRVAGEMLEKMADRVEIWEMMRTGWHVGFPDEYNTGYGLLINNESLPRAINEACVEALK